MCGIAGFSGPGGRSDIEHMVRALAHRGPDGEGFHCDTEHGVHLGHRRLSIIDIEDGAQPMWNEDNTVAVVFNGEIYNHKALRRELESHGHRFATDHSDTEVLVHGWEQWGEGLPSRLNGMFGFAIWDSRKRRIFLARDRFGEKPIYWGLQGGLFLFASELSAIAQHTHFVPGLDRMALKKYFAHGFIPSPNALYTDSHKLPAGNSLSFDLTTREVRVNSYWRFVMEPDDNPPGVDEAAEEIRGLLRQSAERRLMSDVPLGVFLSGGIDSSAVTACIRATRPDAKIDSFAIGFHEKSFDESEHARTVAGALGCRHHEDVLDIDSARALMTDVLGRLDEPLGDSSILPTYLLCRFARGTVKVALGGDGGDELFAGYDPFAALLPARLYKALVPGAMHKGARRLADLIPKSRANMSVDFKLRRALAGLDHGPELWNPAWLAPLEPSEIADLFNEPVHVEDLYSEALSLWRGSKGRNHIDRTLEFYSNFYLADNILTKVDRAGMLNGLEVRSVFLDNDLVDFVRRLPADYKYRGGKRKYVLKKAMAGMVPKSILNRRKKGFGIPTMTWLRDMDIDADGAAEMGLNADFVTNRIQGHRTKGQDHRLFLWCWSVLQRRQQLDLQPLPTLA